MTAGEFEAVAIARRQQFGFLPAATVPDRPDGMNDVSRGQAKAWRDLRFTGTAAVQRAARFEQFGPGCAMNGPVDTAAAQQCAVGGVHDGIAVQGRDVGADGNEAGTGHGRHPEAGGRLCPIIVRSKRRRTTKEAM